MSQAGLADLAIEWSGSSVTVFDRHTGKESHSLEGLRGKTAVVGIGRRACFVRRTFLPPAADDDLRIILAAQLGDLIPVTAATAAYGFRPDANRTEAGVPTLVAAVPVEELRKCLESLRVAGIRPVGVLPVAIGSEHLAQSHGEGPLAVVQTTSDGVAVDIVEKGRLLLSRVLLPNADIGGEVCRTFSVAGLPCGPILAAGNLALPEADLRTPETGLRALLATTAPESLYLELPERVAARHRAEEQSRRRLAGLSALAAAAAVAFAYFENDDAAQRVKRLEGRQQSQQRRVDQIKSVAEADATRTIALQTRLDGAFRPGQKLTDATTVALDLAPADLWLTGLTLERGKAMQIRGTALSTAAVGRYVDALAANPRFRDVKLIFANKGEIDRRAIVQFNLSLFPVGNLPILLRPEARR
jgi:hypothetical protein